MRKVTLLLAGTLLSITLVNAQEKPSRQADTTSIEQSGQSWQKKGYMKMKSSDIPGSLRTTLQGTEYLGWENNGTVYRNSVSNEYLLEVRPGKQQANSKNSTQVYRFDQSGAFIPGSNRPQEMRKP